MPKADRLIRTKLHLPFTRAELVIRPRLQARIAAGLRAPLILITAPAGFGKTTLVASCITTCGMPVAWLSLDKDDNQVERFLSYLVATLQEADKTVGGESTHLLMAVRQTPPESILTSLINDLDAAGKELVLVLDDYQFISSQGVHEAVVFLLEHCPKSFHLVIATRSDPPLPMNRWRARGQMVELRAADLSFTQPEAAEFLNEVMGLRLDTGAVAALEERTEGWIAGLQMAALSMRDREDVIGFIEGFSGTNRYILDYLLEEVLASQPPEIQRFLLYTSILERLTAPLCDTLLEVEAGAEGDKRASKAEVRFSGGSAAILEYLDRANLFLVPLDDKRVWYRYHHLFADLLRTQLHSSLGTQGVAQLHVRVADWHAQNDLLLEAIYHASAAADEERIERFIEQIYRELVSRGEQSWLRSWTNKVSREQVFCRPWLCIYEAYSHAWFGELDEAEGLLEQAEKQIRSEPLIQEAQSLQGHLYYIKSRVIAMRGDLPRAIELCLAARQYIPDNNLALQFDSQITLGYEYYLLGDFDHAGQTLNEMIRSGMAAEAVLNTVAAACLMARLYAVQGRLRQSYEMYRLAEQSIPQKGGEHRGARALVEVGLADVNYEWNDLGAALAHLEQGLDLMPWWGKADDFALTYLTLGRIRLAQANMSGALEAVEKAPQAIQTNGIFCEATRAVELARVKLWLARGDLAAANRWAASQKERLRSDGQFGFDNELAHIALARVYLAQARPTKAGALLAQLEAQARSAGRMGRALEIRLLQALALKGSGDSKGAHLALITCLEQAEPEGYVRIFLDEGRPVQTLLVEWLVHSDGGSLRDFAGHLLSQFETTPQVSVALQAKASPIGDAAASTGQVLIEPLSQRELEVLHILATGRTNQEIARQLVVSPGTIKAHTASIYRKLDVANRTEAVARARKLGILP